MSEGAGAGAGAGTGTGNSGGAGGAGAGAGGDGGAGAGAAGNGAGGGNTGADWTSFFSQEGKDFITTKGFKDPNAFLDSYKNSESLIGKLTDPKLKDRVVALPDKDDDPNWKDINYKLGVPKEAKDYQIEVPEGWGDKAFADKAKEQFHKLGIPKAKAEALAKWWNESVGGDMKAAEEAKAINIKNQNEALKKDWGQAFSQNIMVAKQAALKFGIDDKTLDALDSAMGVDKTMKLLHMLGTSVGEGNFISGSQNNSGFGGILTPGQAQHKIKVLMQDQDFATRYKNGGAKEKEEMERLHMWAYPSQT